MAENYKLLLDQAKEKLNKSYSLVSASLEDLSPYDHNKQYTPKELEPYDALSDRFIRCIEVFIRYFKTYEYYSEASTSQTFRDGLNKMEKLGLITDATLWLQMRDVRNKIVHDYLPGQTQKMFDDIMGAFFAEMKMSKGKIDGLFQ